MQAKGRPLIQMRRLSMSLVKLTATSLLLMMGAMLIACVPVQPWERGNLAKPQMALDPYPGQSLYREHNYGSREASSGGSSAKGGGCGCY
jgi:Domain of unknown function (DUF4266)